jgi:peroxiredoxin (alkyl hydroperoxide reductase subunit C)
MTGKAEGCVQPAGGPVLPESSGEPKPSGERQEAVSMTAQVGKPAPDFEASAYEGGGFRNVKLSDYKGQWVALCFYPGDFTFV